VGVGDAAVPVRILPCVLQLFVAAVPAVVRLP